jgi:hypothetical protein
MKAFWAFALVTVVSAASAAQTMEQMRAQQQMFQWSRQFIAQHCKAECSQDQKTVDRIIEENPGCAGDKPGPDCPAGFRQSLGLFLPRLNECKKQLAAQTEELSVRVPTLTCPQIEALWPSANRCISDLKQRWDKCKSDEQSERWASEDFLQQCDDVLVRTVGIRENARTSAKAMKKHPSNSTGAELQVAVSEYEDGTRNATECAKAHALYRLPSISEGDTPTFTEVLAPISLTAEQCGQLKERIDFYVGSAEFYTKGEGADQINAAGMLATVKERLKGLKKLNGEGCKGH